MLRIRKKLLVALAATAALGAASLVAAPPADLRGHARYLYLNGQGGGSRPARPAAPHQYAAPQRSVLQVFPLGYPHGVPQVASGAAPVFQPAPTVAPAPAALPPTAARRPAAAPAADLKPVAYVMAHLPQGADLWIEETLMVSDNQQSEVILVTPPLEPGKWYTYTARARWVEDGKWVGQMHTFDVRVGDLHHMEVTPSTAPSVEKEVAASLAALPEVDRKATEAQKRCAVQDTIRLGSMGPPVKVTLDGKDVYLCCKACEAAARKDPAKALATAEANKANK